MSFWNKPNLHKIDSDILPDSIRYVKFYNRIVSVVLNI